MLHVRARSLSLSAESKTRIVSRQHFRQLSGPIDVDLAASVSLAKLFITPVEDVVRHEYYDTKLGTDYFRQNSAQPMPSPTLPQPSSHEDSLPQVTSPRNGSEDKADRMEDVMMTNCSMSMTISPRHSYDVRDTQPDAVTSFMVSSAVDVATSSSHLYASLHEQLANMDTTTGIRTEPCVAPLTEVVVDHTSHPAASPESLAIPHASHTSSVNCHDDPHTTLSSFSRPSSFDDTACGDVSPKASSPLPLSSMPASPATSLGSSPRKSHDSSRVSARSSPVILSPYSMSADNSRASSPVKAIEPATSSPVKAIFRRLVASSPPPSSILGKRAGSEGEKAAETLGGSSPVKRIRTEGIRSSPPPAATTWRQTASSQQRSRRKLKAPFRSPAMVRKSLPGPVGQDTAESSMPNITRPAIPRPAPANASKTMTKLALGSRAAAQFKSPVAARSTGCGRSVVLPTATNLALERKVTTLKRAIKIKRDQDEEKLAILAKKWREAGREAAYELWGIVRNMTTDGPQAKAPGSDSWRSGWGWDGNDEPEAECSADDALKVDEEEEKPEETLGIMLRKLGIDPETLGWDDALESFVD